MRIIIGDDHEMFRNSLRALLEKEGFEIEAEAADGLDALKQARQKKPEILIVDMNMPKLNGIEVVREVSRYGLDMKVIILTMFKDRHSVREALKAGANGYILKTQASTELLYALRQLRDGNHYLSPKVTDSIIDNSPEEEVLESGQPEEELTSRERQILQMVAEGHATKDIARMLNLAVKTVESHRYRLMRKIDTNNVAGMVRHAVRQGIIRI